MINTKKLALLSSVAVTIVGASTAQAFEPTGFEKALAEAKPILNARLRFEHVDQDGVSEEGEALTYRIRAGFETGAVADTKLLVDFEYVKAPLDDYSSPGALNPGFPVVADPEVTELNRLQLTNTSIKDTTITLGRQRIIQDDARFVGNVGWRQDEQTFDALRIVNKSVKGLTLDLTYIDQVNRIFPQDTAPGKWDSESVLVNAKYDVPMEAGALSVSGFAYLLDFKDDAPTMSSETYGVGAALKKGLFAAKARYAIQSDYGDNTTEYEADYYQVEGTLAKNGFALTAGYEVLGSDDGVASFQTPLATLHAFNGFDDHFLATPATGLEDTYGKLAYTKKNVGAADMVKFVVGYHDFAADEGGADYGTEIDAVALAKFGKTSVLLKYSDYEADDLGPERQKLWAQIEWNY